MPKISALILSFLLLAVAGHAAADEYSLAIGEPLLGSSVPKTRVSMGVKVNINRSWDALTEKEKLAWREFTELTDPDVTPPFPKPNIRNYLKRLDSHDFPQSTDDNLVRQEGLMMIVRVSETGTVSQIELMEGSEAGRKTLTEMEKSLAARYITAMMGTKFSPALYKGQPAPSAFPMRILAVTVLH